MHRLYVCRHLHAADLIVTAVLQGIIPGSNTVTCTACAGTLLLEFGMLSQLTGNPVYMKHAQRSAKVGGYRVCSAKVGAQHGYETTGYAQ